MVERINFRQPWDDPQAHSSHFKEKQKQSLAEQQVAFHATSMYSSSIASLNPQPAVEASKSTVASTAPSKERSSGVLAWLDSKWNAVLDYCGLKSSSVKEIDSQQDYVKKSNA